MSKALYAFIGLTIAASLTAPASAAINYTSSKSNTGNLTCQARKPSTGLATVRRTRGANTVSSRSNTGGNNVTATGSKSGKGNSCAGSQSVAHPTHTSGPISSINYNTSKSNTGNATFTGSSSNQTQQAPPTR